MSAQPSPLPPLLTELRSVGLGPGRALCHLNSGGVAIASAGHTADKGAQGVEGEPFPLQFWVPSPAGGSTPTPSLGEQECRRCLPPRHRMHPASIGLVGDLSAHSHADSPAADGAGGAPLPCLRCWLSYPSNLEKQPHSQP